MNNSYSRLSYLAIKQETTENVAVIPGVFIPFLNEDIVPEYQPTPAMSVSQTRMKNIRAVKTALPSPTGNISALAEPKTLGHFLKGIYGAIVSGIYAPTTNASGKFVVGETITDTATGLKSATVLAADDELGYLLLGPITGTFTPGEEIEGDDSGETADIGTYNATVYGHEFKAPQNDLPTFTVEFGYADRAKRFTGVKFVALGSIGQSDNMISQQTQIVARAEFLFGKVEEQLVNGSGTKTIKVDQTTGLVAGDTIKVWRPSTKTFLDFASSGVKTHTIATVPTERSITVTNLQTQLEVGDEIVLAPQTATYDVAKEFFWIGGSEVKIGDSAATIEGLCVEDFTMSLTNDFETRHCGNGLNHVDRFPKVIHVKGLEGAGSISKTYGDLGLLTRLRNNEDTAIQVKHVGEQIGSTGINYSLTLTAPTTQFENFSPNISEDALLDQEVNYTLYNNDNYCHKALLISDETTY